MPLGSLVSAALKRSGGKTVLVDGDRRWTALGLDEVAERVACGLAARLSKGERVVLFMANRAEYLILQLALERAGLVRVPVNRLSTAGDVERIVEHGEATALFCDESTRPRTTGICGIWICSVDGDAERGPPWTALLTADTRSLPGSAPADLASINYTSGTSGRPKGAMLSAGNWLAVWRNMLVDRDIRQDDVLAHVGPLTHASGAYAAPHWLRGAVNVIVDYHQPADLFDAIAREQVTVFSCVPTLLTRLVADPSLGRAQLGSLRRIAYGAEPMPPNTLRAARAAFGPILVQNYGLTEAMMTVAYLAEDAHDVSGASGNGLIGTPYTFVEVVLRAPDGRPVPPGAQGEITVRSDHVMQGYWKMPEETAAVLKDGWLWTGDLAVEEAGGLLRLVGRAKDLVICGGFNIYPREVEDVLASLEGVCEAAVFGVPDAAWGERLVGAVTGRIDLEALTAAAKPRLGIKTPRQWIVRDALPRTANGKVDKALLRQEVLDGER